MADVVVCEVVFVIPYGNQLIVARLSEPPSAVSTETKLTAVPRIFIGGGGFMLRGLGDESSPVGSPLGGLGTKSPRSLQTLFTDLTAEMIKICKFRAIDPSLFDGRYKRYFGGGGALLSSPFLAPSVYKMQAHWHSLAKAQN